MTVSIGIDLGTTNSAVGFFGPDGAKILELPGGKLSMPSAVSFAGEEIMVGSDALGRAVKHPEFTILNFKRLMGERYNDDINMGPQVTRGDNGWAAFRGPKRNWSPIELSTLVLEHLKKAAETKLGRTVDTAVVTVPAYFNDDQKRATLAAAELAGFAQPTLLGEPTAAAIAYGLDKEKFATVCVWDMGGGTFDVSIMEIGEGTHNPKATNGNTRLGGLNFDEEIARWFVAKHKEETGQDLAADQYRFLRLMRESEKGKVDLSDKTETDITLSFAYVDKDAEGAPVHVNYTLTRAELEGLVEYLLSSAITSTAAALREAKLSIKQIDHIILVGGMTKMPLVRDTVAAFFKKKPLTGVNPDHIVALGAAIKAASNDQRIAPIMDKDILPQAVGIEVPGGAFRPVIKKGAAFGTNTSVVLTNEKPGQKILSVGLYQGDSPVAAENTPMGRLDYELKHNYAKQGAEFELMFEIDDNGLLSILGVDNDGDPDTTHEIHTGDSP